MKTSYISRRRFLRNLGIIGGATALASCGSSVTEERGASDGEGQMTMRHNPFSGDDVSVLGFGCMRFPTRIDESGNKVIDQEAVNEMIDYALEHGVNYYDTSPAYCEGHSEEALGTALARHPRNEYLIATKLSNFAPQTWSAEASKDMFESSLRYLQTDYVDYLLLHAVGMGGMANLNGRYIDNGILDWLVEQKKEGRIRNLGFSYHGDVEVFDYLLEMMDRGEIRWDFVQIQMNYIDWLHSKEMNPRNTNADYLYNELSRRGIPVVIMEPLLGGRLANVPAGVNLKMKERKPDDSAAAWAFRFAATPEGVLTVLSGMTCMEHLKDNLATLSPLVPLDDDEQTFMQRMALEILHNDTVPCTGCEYCMPCPYGVDIPGVFAHYNKCINEGNTARDIADPNYMHERRAFLYGYDKSVTPLRQADRCVNCGACLSHCPQSINIPLRLKEIDLFAENLRQNPL